MVRNGFRNHPQYKAEAITGYIGTSVLPGKAEAVELVSRSEASTL